MGIGRGGMRTTGAVIGVDTEAIIGVMTGNMRRDRRR